MSRAAHLLFVVVAAIVVPLGLAIPVGLGVSGCSSCKGTSGTKATREDVSLMPKDTNFVLMANLTKMRGAPLWKHVIELRDSTPDSKARYDELVKKTGLDPLVQIDSVFMGFPTNAQQSGEFGAIVRGGPFDEARIVAWAKEEATKAAGEVVVNDYNGKKLYSDRQGQTVVAFIDTKTVVFGGKEWIKKMIDLHAKEGESAAQNPALMTLVKATKTSEGLWVAGVVPEEVRARFKDDPRLASAATMKDVHASIDVQSGFSLTSTVELAGPPEAKELAARINDQIVDAKKSPQIQMLGMSQFLEAVKVASEGASFHLDLKLTQQQVDDLINRVQGLLKTMGGALGGGGGGGIDLTPPGAGSAPSMPSMPQMPAPPPQ